MMTKKQGKSTDRNKKKELEVQYELMRIIAEQNHEIMFEYDVEKNRAALYEVVNGNFVERHGYEDYIDKIDEHLQNLDSDGAQLYKKTFFKCLKKPSHYVIDLKLSLNKKKKEWYRLFFVSVGDSNGNITTVAGRFVSIHSEKISNEIMKHKAETDALTDVYNHITFENLCSIKLKKCKSKVLFILFDIDDFKIINDTLGHNVGDLILSQTGSILKETLGDNGYAGRLGGDEFAVMGWGFTDEAAMRKYCEDLRLALKRIIFDMEYSVSMGVSFQDGRKLTFKDVYYEADQATYAAKKLGKNQIIFYKDISNQNLDEIDKLDLGRSDRNSSYQDIEEWRVFDKRAEYILWIDMNTKSFKYANKTAREAMNIPMSEFENMSCLNLFSANNKLCSRCGESGEQYFFSKSDSRSNDKLTKMFGPKDFIIHIVPTECNGNQYRMLYLIDADNQRQLVTSFGRKDIVFSSIENVIDYVLNGNGNYEHKQIIKMACDFYDADCGILIYSNHGKFDSSEIVCKPNVSLMGEIAQYSITNGDAKKYWRYLDADGTAVIRNIQKIKNEHKELYKVFVDSRIWSVIGLRIGKEEQPAGFFALFNPRQNEEEQRFYKFVAAIFADELMRREAQEELEYSKSFDALTGIYSRHSFGKIKDSWEHYEISSIGIFAADIIGLKFINREFGYENGNKRLCQLADCISTIFAGYMVCRYEDDQIVAFCRNIEEDGFQKLVNWCIEMMQDFDFKVAVGYGWNHEVNIKNQMTEINEMIARDKKEKIAGSSEFDINDKIIQDVKALLEENKFLVYLQPKVNIRTGETIGAEALIRLKDKEKGIVSPIHFINLFEKYNIVQEIDLYVLDEVCKFQKNMLEQGKKPLPISVNFSKKTLEYEKLINHVGTILDKYELPNGLVQIEITETVGDMDHMLIRDVANSLRTMGFVLDMDDFGTKYSNISMLVQFQFGVAKIDRSLIKDITENEKSVIVLRHLTDMISELGIECIIEGAETEEQIDIIKTMNCDVVQGFYYGKPVDINDFYRMFVDKS